MANMCRWLTGIALVAMVAVAQSKNGVVSPRPEFEVSSIKPSPPGDTRPPLVDTRPAD